MRPARGARPPAVLLWLLAIAACGWAGSWALARRAPMPPMCGFGGGAGEAAGGLALAGEWLLMVVAMMPPLLAMPVLHVWRSSLASRRARALALYGFAYAGVWMAAGCVLVPATAALRAALPQAAALPVALALALAWSASPAAQSAHNRCHRMRRIGAFGPRADRDCLAAGLVGGRDCALSCWPWMIVPMMAEHAPGTITAAVTIFLFVRRLAPPASPAWRTGSGLRAFRAAVRTSWAPRSSTLPGPTSLRGAR